MGRGPGGGIDELARLVAWAGQGAEGIDWTAVERRLGHRIPCDYKGLVARFPRGVFNDYLTVAVPGDNGDETDLIGGFEFVLEDFRNWRSNEPDMIPYPLYPEPQGLVPWGGSTQGETFFWLPEGADPDEWDVVAVSSDGSGWRRFPASATDFVTAVVTGTLRSDVIAHDVQGPPRFAPYPDPVDESATRRDWEPHPELEWLLHGEATPTDELPRVMDVVPMPQEAPAPLAWETPVRQLGRMLPADYRALIDAYGAGTFLDVRVLLPGAEQEAFDMIAATEELARDLQERYAMGEREHGERIRPRVHPERNGVIVWGAREDGTRMFWVTQPEEVNNWHVGVVKPDLISFIICREKSMTGFLASYLTEPDHGAYGRLRGAVGDPRFVPARP
ncbi:hypothetical protein ACFY4C_03270 [Actinomadura viridis]|uniref:hypothetical protein n=1 Tax=Actinomadura viridis TaxID=58110 RepID=UPI0036749577